MVRGLNAYMALGLIFSATALWWIITQRLSAKEPLDFLTQDLRIKPSLTRLGLALTLCSVFGTLATTMHGFALLLYAKSLTPTEWRTLFADSTWIIWVIFTIIGTTFAASIIFWLHDKLVVAVRSMERNALAAISIGPAQTAAKLPVSTNPENPQEVINILDKYWEARERIGVAMSKIPTWPLPQGAGVTFALSVVLQVVNIIGAAMTLLYLEKS
jgi:hypothetical protein